MDLEYFEQEIEEKEEKINLLEREIEKLRDQKADFIKKNCRYKKEKKCTYFDEDIDDDECSDCSSNLNIGQVKRKSKLLIKESIKG